MNEINTPEELDALPVGSVVVNPFDNSEFHKTRTGRWIDSDGSRRLSSEMTQDEQEYNLYRADAPAPPTTHHHYTPEQRHAAEQDEALRRVAERALFGTGEVIDIVLRALGDAPAAPAEDREALALPGVDSPARDDLSARMRRALDEDMQYDDEDWTRLADAALAWFAARRPAPVDAAHTVTAEWDDGWSGTTFTFHCHAGPESMCHAVYDCGCEEWARDEVEGGRPWHEAYDRETDDEVRHYGTFNPDTCGLRDWFENTDDPMRGEITFAVDAEFDGDYYLFRPMQEVRHDG